MAPSRSQVERDKEGYLLDAVLCADRQFDRPHLDGCDGNVQDSAEVSAVHLQDGALVAIVHVNG